MILQGVFTNKYDPRSLARFLEEFIILFFFERPHSFGVGFFVG